MVAVGSMSGPGQPRFLNGHRHLGGHGGCGVHVRARSAAISTRQQRFVSIHGHLGGHGGCVVHVRVRSAAICKRTWAFRRTWWLCGPCPGPVSRDVCEMALTEAQGPVPILMLTKPFLPVCRS